MAKLTWFPRALGLATAAYGVAVTVRPALMAGPTGLTDAKGEPSTGVALLTRSIGIRDIASGLAMAFAPAGTPLRAAIAVRVASDVGDAIGFGVGLPDADTRRKAALVAGVWGGLCALSALASRR
ncbi:hypothetical protein [Actinokineospora sp. NBRC 105648]|uniref:hypothetical protein n=1 Tax=Actinokineospora sp. NBRC 105648 TaxID=3032206 RepID=UPI0024A4711A|nr:hypothetical protein [Actinokineospora sp. NBRC 105648]GLZ41013.1 hypothetical protein Acsp05_46370 [Actinokineospora sp. NBRC 105648]